MKNEAKVRCIKSYIDAYNRFDVDTMMEQLHEEVVFQNYSSGEMTLETIGASEFREQAVIAAKIFRARNQVIQSLETKGHGILVHISYEGTLDQDLPNGMKSGDKLELVGTTEFEFRGGKIVLIVDRS